MVVRPPKMLILIPNIFRSFRVLYTSQLDPLTVALQEEIDRNCGFDSDHIFYKIILHGLKSATATVRTFQWPDDIAVMPTALSCIIFGKKDDGGLQS